MSTWTKSSKTARDNGPGAPRKRQCDSTVHHTGEHPHHQKRCFLEHILRLALLKLPCSIRPSTSSTCLVPMSLSMRSNGARFPSARFGRRSHRTAFSSLPKVADAWALTRASRNNLSDSSACSFCSFLRRAIVRCGKCNAAAASSRARPNLPMSASREA
jgi:hypothetical protein